ncbi:hypothetical protein GCM10007276_28960 [Agaricicola taiwanensis]|uniref:Ankyrin repeat domain-containing protein n=1 Tax=Agaricicola taiwanensis TaxID=591372 RepID=A0A8J3DWP9_9RHOB|nr:ankyrin repeat domain-containing protein [Agaricicola taiwanensis]GGE50055.1 hypothetical protein GCM10007276_28960 [Agaricicola taiwanensis]
MYIPSVLRDAAVPTHGDPALAFSSAVRLTKRERSDDLETAQARFYEAVRGGDTETVAEMLANPPEGFDINAAGSRGTALHVAVEADADVEMFRLLVDTGRIDLAALDEKGRSAYRLAQAAAEKGDEAARWTADYLFRRMTREFARSILDGNQDRAKELLEAGADPMVELDLGITGLAYAAGNRNPDTVKAILAKIPKDKLQEFLDRPSDVFGNTALHAAAISGDRESYDALVKAGADESIANTDGDLPGALLENSLERRGDGDRNKPNYHVNPFQLLWDVLTVAAGRAYDPSIGPFADPPEPDGPAGTEMDYLPPQGSVEEQAREYVRRISEALDRDLPFDFFRTWETVTVLGTMEVHGAGANGEAHMLARLHDLAMFVQTPTGRLTINAILDSGERVHLRPSDQGNFTRANPSGGIDVFLTGRPGTEMSANEPWGSEEGMPTDVILAHELIHVARRLRGVTDNGYFLLTGSGNPPERLRIQAEEIFAIGLGPAQFETIGTENAYRRERGGAQHPEMRLPPREFYSDRGEVQANGFWAGIDADNADDWWQQYREQRGGAHTHGGGRPGHHHNHPRSDLGETYGEHVKALTPQDYEDLLNGTVVDLAQSYDPETGKVAPLTAQGFRERTEEMLLYNLIHMEGGAEGGERLKEAIFKTMDDIRGRIGNVPSEHARAVASEVRSYLSGLGGIGDVAYFGEQAWRHYTAFLKGEEFILEAQEDYEAPKGFIDEATFNTTLDSLMQDYIGDINLGSRTLTGFEGVFAEKFKVLVRYFLDKDERSSGPGADRDKWVDEARDKAWNAIKEKLPTVYGDNGNWAMDILQGHMDRHGGKDRIDELADEAFDERGTASAAERQTYQNLLNGVVTDLAASYDDGDIDPLTAGPFRQPVSDMVLHNLKHMEGRRDDPERLAKAIARTLDDIEDRIGNVSSEHHKDLVKKVRNYLHSTGGKGDVATFGERIWEDYQAWLEGEEPPAPPSSDYTPPSGHIDEGLYTDTLASLARDFVHDINLGSRTLTGFKGVFAEKFKVLVKYHLGRNFYQFGPHEDRDHWVSDARDKAWEDLKTALPEAYAAHGDWGMDVLQGHMDRHGGKDRIDELANEAFDEIYP